MVGRDSILHNNNTDDTVTIRKDNMHTAENESRTGDWWTWESEWVNEWERERERYAIKWWDAGPVNVGLMIEIKTGKIYYHYFISTT